MKKSKSVVLIVSLFTLLGIGFVSCTDSEKYARLNIRLTDAPGDYDEVNVDIQGIQVHSENGEQGGGWISLDVNAGVYNLLELTNELDTLIGTGELPPGKISQVRLILGNNNTLKIGDEVIPLKTPSAQQSGLKLNVHKELIGGITYTLLLDFDAARSVVKSGASGQYILKPVIRVITEATSGAIAGLLSNPEASAAVYAIVDTDTLGTTFTDEEGKFMIKGLSAGLYTVSFSPAEGFIIQDIDDVEVSIGIVTDLGEVLVEEEEEGG
jgi:hypothetical protein